jgi:hypothetical protein
MKRGDTTSEATKIVNNKKNLAPVFVAVFLIVGPFLVFGQNNVDDVREILLIALHKAFFSLLSKTI